MSRDRDSLTTRDRLEFLVAESGNPQQQSNGQFQAFWAGVGVSAIVAGSVFITHWIDTHPQVTTGDTTQGQATNAAPLSSVANGDSHGVRLASNFSKIETTRPPETRSANLTSTATVALPPIRLPELHPSVPVPPRPVTRPSSLVTPISVADDDPSIQDRTKLTLVKGLSASRSVITGVVDPQTMTASYYWTFTLKNRTGSSKEAQMNILLPDGAVVSRATLWINGRAEEAAFNSTSSVQYAYDWIVVHHRDPLLITQTEENTINLKASPVMPDKEMKIRLGITVPMKQDENGRCQMQLPHVIDANLDLSCKQNVHLTSDGSLSANNSNMSLTREKGSQLLRGNVSAADLKQLSIFVQRDAQFKSFATRATHSNPPAYIVASLEALPNTDVSTLRFTKTMEKPDCEIIADDHAAFRLSYLWVKSEIERLVKLQDQYQAVELATVYRVVSPVSGAVVLERQSDYDSTGLDRNMYRSLSYTPDLSAQNEPQTEESIVTRDMPADELAAVNDARGYYAPGADGEAVQPAPAAPAAGFSGPVPSAMPSGGLVPPPPAAPISAPLAMPPSGVQNSSLRLQTAASMQAMPAPYMVSSRRRAEHNSESFGKMDARRMAPRAAARTKNASGDRFSESKAVSRDKLGNKLVEKSVGLQSQTLVYDSGSYSQQSVETEKRDPSAAVSKPAENNLNKQQQNVVSKPKSEANLAVQLAGPAEAWLEESAQVANWDGTTILMVIVLPLLGLTLAGGLALLALSAARLLRRQPGALKLCALGLTWLAIALYLPGLSQLAVVVAAAVLLLQSLTPRSRSISL